MKKTATIYDYARMCNAPKYDTQSECRHCPLSSYNNSLGKPCGNFLRNHTDKANEIILNWCKEHPVETRQDRFLKMFPNAKTNTEGRIAMCPKNLDKNYECSFITDECVKCLDYYWLAEVEENE